MIVKHSSIPSSSVVFKFLNPILLKWYSEQRLQHLAFRSTKFIQTGEKDKLVTYASEKSFPAPGWVNQGHSVCSVNVDVIPENVR